MADNKETNKPLNLDEKVVVRNIANWNVAFAKIDTPGDLLVSPNGLTRLTRNEIIAQVNSGNKLFTGIDGYGSHATLIIDDAPTREEVGFDSTDEDRKQVCFSEARIKQLFAIKNIDKFEDEFTQAIVTRAEMYAAVQAIKKLRLNDYSKICFVEDYTGYKLRKI